MWKKTTTVLHRVSSFYRPNLVEYFACSRRNDAFLACVPIKIVKHRVHKHAHLSLSAHSSKLAYKSIELIFMKGPQIRDLSDYTPNKSWLGFLRCCVTSNFKSMAQPVFRVWEPGCGCVVTSFPVNQRTVWTKRQIWPVPPLCSKEVLLMDGL